MFSNQNKHSNLTPTAGMLGPVNGVEQLCQKCGLCCDSTLFADVELRAGDDAAQLRKHGLKLEKKGLRKTAFAQPCACFDGVNCCIYADRPRRCRTFECGLLKKVDDGEMTAATALNKIASAKVKAEHVRELLRLNGQRDEALALTHRYQAAMAAPVNFTEESSSENRGELMMAVNDLMQVLQRDFLEA
jgi:Fe-S-cluster containining protein